MTASAAASPVGRRERWSGRAGFIFAAMGSAVGLGSIWKFPYEVGANGGSAFLLFYFLGLALVVLPLLLIEFAIGRAGRADAAASLRKVAAAGGGSQAWAGVGVLGIVTSALILSFYSVIGGWALAYFAETVALGLPSPEMPAAQARFSALTASPWHLAVYHAAFMALTAVIVARGIVRGIERACTIFMPLMIVIILALAIFSLAEGNARAALRFLFQLDWAHLNARTALEALGLGFFSIGVGLAVMITYAAHAGPDLNLRQVATITIAADTAISLMAGLAIFPIVFAFGISPSSGPGLMFVSLPIAFAQLPFGTLAAVAFFLLLAMAGLSSAISLLEMPVAWLERRFGLSRPRAAYAAALACWAGGLASVFSFNLLAGWFPLARFPMFATATLFDLLDHLTSNLLLPLGGFALALFGGWVMPARLIAEQLGLGPRANALLRLMLRYVAPATIAAVTVLPAVL